MVLPANVEFNIDIDSIHEVWLKSVEETTPSPANLLTLNEVQATDIRIDALKVSFKEVQACLNLHAVAQRRKRNKAHPIHRLSPELFLKILSFALQPTSSLFIVVKAGARDESNLGVAHCLKNSAFKNMTKRSASRTQGDLTGPLDQDFVPKLQALAQVSKAWHLVVKTSPSLWTFVTNLDSSAAVALTLRKSKGLPLDVELSGTSAQDVREGGRLGKTEELILAQTHRWRCLELSTLKPKHRLVERVMRSDPPHLKGLMINNCSVAVAIPNGVLGRLHHLEVHGTPIRWAYFPSSCNLKTLRLRSDNSKHCPTLVQLLAILRAAPGLLVLGLHFPSLEQSPPSNDSPLSLLQLTTLFLRLPQHAIDSILARIQFPSCTRLMLVNTSFQMTDLQRLSISHLTSAIQSVMSSFRHVKITVSASTVALSGVGGLNAAHHTRHPDLRIELQTQILSSLLLSLNAILESVVPVPSITLVHTSATPFDLIHPFLCTLCPITELHLVDPTEDMIQDYATLLGEPCGPADATNRWSLPHLKVLTLRSRQVNPKLLLKTLRRRYGKPQDTRERPIESMPAALGLLAVEAETSLSDKNRGKLEEILGVEKVTWSIPGQSEH